MKIDIFLEDKRTFCSSFRKLFVIRDIIYIDFMKPSWRFPVYWTEEWDMQHTWHRDGSYLANYYNSNRVAWVECDVNGILGENYYFDKTTSDSYVRGGKYR